MADGERFDRLLRQIGANSTRRGALLALLAGAFVGAPTGTPARED